MRDRNEDDLDDLHPLNYVSYVAYHIEKIPHERIIYAKERERERKRYGRGVRGIDPYEINCWKPIEREDDKSILFLANHATCRESNGDY